MGFVLTLCDVLTPNIGARKKDFCRGPSINKISPAEVKPKIEVDDAHESEVRPVIATADLFQQIDEKIKPLIIKYENRRGFSCKVCDRNGDSGTIKDHIEAKHLEGISIPCNLCKIMLKSRSSLKMHKRRNHQKYVLS